MPLVAVRSQRARFAQLLYLSYFPVSPDMTRRLMVFAEATALILAFQANGQNSSTPGPAWMKSDYATSSPVYPSR
jgi:hypothetical protein